MSTANGTDVTWRPHEANATIRSEQTWLLGGFITAVAYGAATVLCVQCFFMLMRTFKKRNLTRDALLTLFVVLMFALNTALMGATIQYTQQAFVDFRDYPGGPSAFERVFFHGPISSVANGCLVVTTMLADALLVCIFNLAIHHATPLTPALDEHFSFGVAWLSTRPALPQIGFASLSPPHSGSPSLVRLHRLGV